MDGIKLEPRGRVLKHTPSRENLRRMWRDVGVWGGGDGDWMKRERWRLQVDDAHGDSCVQTSKEFRQRGTGRALRDLRLVCPYLKARGRESRVERENVRAEECLGPTGFRIWEGRCEGGRRKDRERG